MIMTSVNWQFAAMKLCALLKKPELGGTLVAILMKTKKHVYGSSVFSVHVLQAQCSLPDSVQWVCRSQEQRKTVT